MKKITAIILSLALVCILSLTFAEQTGVTGTWYLIEAHNGDLVLPISMLGMEMEVTLNEDGSAVITGKIQQEAMENRGTWEQSDNKVIITTENMALEMMLENEEMSVDMGGGTTGIFRQTPPETFVPPEVVAAETAEAFHGTWQVENLMSEDGSVVPAALLGYDHIFVVEEGKATETALNPDDAVTVEYTTEFTEGTLVLTAKNPDDPVSGGANTAITVQLTENGQLVYEITNGEQKLVCYLKPVVEE